MREQSRIANIVSSKFYLLLLFFVSFVFVVLFSRSTSFLYVFEGADPSIFKQMGRAILKGKIMYIDYFDNKGCLLYFIHALGLRLGGDFAILLMQVVSLTVTLFIWDKLLALYRPEKERVICLCIALVLLLCFYGAGDQTQEWCLPFISYPLLIYFRAYKLKTEIQPLQIFVIGLCFGIITFIQINNACAFLGFIAYLWIQYIGKKIFKQLFLSILCFFFGWLTIAFPCVLYFYIMAGWHGVYEMVYASFLSNLEYIGNQWKPQLTSMIPYIIFLLAFLSIQIINTYKEKNLIIPFLMSFCLFIGTFGKQCNQFYLIAIIPMCIICMMTFNFSENKKAKSCLCGILLTCMMFYSCNPMFHFVKDFVFQKEQELTIYEDFHRCIEKIPENERDSIYNYNLYWHGTSMMEHEHLLPCNRVLFSMLVFSLPTLWKEETDGAFYPPKWILVSFNKYIKNDDVYFIMENYKLSYTFHYDKKSFKKLKFGDEFDVYLYCRND